MELSKNYLTVFCAHIDYMSLQNLESLALMVAEKHCLDMTERWTDGRRDQWTCLNRFSRSTDQEHIYFIESQMTPSPCGFKEKSGLKISIQAPASILVQSEVSWAKI